VSKALNKFLNLFNINWDPKFILSKAYGFTYIRNKSIDLK